MSERRAETDFFFWLLFLEGEGSCLQDYPVLFLDLLVPNLKHIKTQKRGNIDRIIKICNFSVPQENKQRKKHYLGMLFYKAIILYMANGPFSAVVHYTSSKGFLQWLKQHFRSLQWNRITYFCSENHQNGGGYDLYQQIICISFTEESETGKTDRMKQTNKKDVELFGRGSKTKTQVYLWL